MHHFRYLLSAIAIIAGIILILCGMNFYRALFLIIFGVLSIPFKFADLQNTETPKGAKFWGKKVLVGILSLLTTLSLCNFLISQCTDGFPDVILWLGICIICGILFGTFDYFAHNTGGDEAEFEARKKRQQEIGELYDKLMEDK